MTKTMAEVLAEHWSASTHSDRKPFVDKCDGCGAVIMTWGEGGDMPALLVAHQAAALSAAGFGLVADAKREAWDAGMMDQFEADLLGKPSPQNPYRDKQPRRRRGQRPVRTPQPEGWVEPTYPPDPEWGTDPRGRFWYQDYDGESLHVWRDKDGELWIDKRGQGPVFVRAEDIPVIAKAMRGEG